MPDSIFRADEGRFVATGYARGPWDPKALHGGAPAALMAGALERTEPRDGLAITRLTYEFRRPVPAAALTLTTRVVRSGRRVQELEAELRDGEQTVCLARALRMAPLAAGVPAERDAPEIPGPDEGHPLSFTLTGDQGPSFSGAMDMRWISGDLSPGPATVWMMLRYPIVAGEPLTPLMRVAATADFGNGVGAPLSWDRFVFINADLTIYLYRQPVGEWFALESRAHLHAGGAGVSESVIHDRHGPIGRALQALIVAPRDQPAG